MIKDFCKLKKAVLASWVRKSVLDALLSLAFDRFSIFLPPTLLIPALLPPYTFLFCLLFLALILGDTTPNSSLVVWSIEVNRAVILLMNFL